MSAKRNNKERRLYERRTYVTPVIFEDEFGEGLFVIPSRDMSESGVSLESDIPARVGSLLFLSFLLPGYKRPLRLTGEVVRMGEKAGSPMGVRFVGVSEASLKRLQGFIREAKQ